MEQVQLNLLLPPHFLIKDAAAQPRAGGQDGTLGLLAMGTALGFDSKIQDFSWFLPKAVEFRAGSTQNWWIFG